MDETGIDAALRALDPVARAMLDLSIRQQLPDAAIAELAQMPADEVERWRDDVLGEVAAQAGMRGPGARWQVERALREIEPETPSEPGAQHAPRARPAPAAVPQDDRAEPSPARSAGRWGIPATLVLICVLAIVLVLVASSGGGDSTTQAPPAAQTTASSTTTTGSRPAPQPLAALPKTPRGTATAAITPRAGRDRLTVKLAGLPKPPGVYELWLYNTLIGAKPLGSTASGSGKIEATLPASAKSFRFLDLSRERGSRDRVHSGVSIRRIEIRSLLDRG